MCNPVEFVSIAKDIIPRFASIAFRGMPWQQLELAPVTSSDAGSPVDVKHRITLKWRPHAR
jgi:hypothetical protein